MKTLGVLLFDGFEVLDVFGPLEMFGQLPRDIKTVLISEHQGLIKSAQGQQVMSDFDFKHAPDLDVLLIPGGMGTRSEVYNQSLIAWIKSQSTQVELTLSVCTGAALLAKAGVLDGRRATTNILAFDWVAEQGGSVDWVKDVRWVDDGNVITSAGVSAGMDMSLYVIERLFSTAIRDDVARLTEYYSQ
ncbi:MAG: DJ-1/PfpI family protein [Legionellaceae bacterium]|nr:DJ-1/PfpI family protein [Legionellaceae bacterium]